MIVNINVGCGDGSWCWCDREGERWEEDVECFFLVVSGDLSVSLEWCWVGKNVEGWE